MGNADVGGKEGAEGEGSEGEGSGRREGERVDEKVNEPVRRGEKYDGGEERGREREL